MKMCENYEDTVDVPLKEYKELIRDQKVLRALEAGGVDDWEWYSESLESIDLSDLEVEGL